MSRTTMTYAEKAAKKDEQMLKLKNEKKQLLQKHRAEERKARTHRLCKRHGLLESAMPDLITITDEQFEDFIRRGINTTYGQKILAELIAKAGAAATPSKAETPPATQSSGGAIPPKAEQQGA